MTVLARRASMGENHSLTPRRLSLPGRPGTFYIGMLAGVAFVSFRAWRPIPELQLV